MTATIAYNTRECLKSALASWSCGKRAGWTAVMRTVRIKDHVEEH